jgi:hypothetical protein
MLYRDNKLLAEAYQSIYETVNTAEVSDEEIKKAVAAVLKIPTDQVVVNKTNLSGEEKVTESSALLAVTIAGLVPPALNLVGNTLNKAKQLFGLNEKEKELLNQLNTKIKEEQELIKNLDTKNAPNEEQERGKLNQLLKQRDAQFGTKIGNWSKHASHNMHHLFTLPIRKFLQSIAWTSEKFGKKTKLSDEKYIEKIANIIYAVSMTAISGTGILTHIGHLSGVGPVVVTIADSIKAGKSVSDTIKGILLLV